MHTAVSYPHLRAHETCSPHVCCLHLEQKQVLQPTSDIILYPEQLIQIAQVLSGFP
ncbi:hypothetical protein, partial [Enterobacter hormaechei]|uniref:hypothetical protein n=1 Tax=Enterobacter hormaechei TaxID=158836 RepID=UPI003C73B1C9